MFDHRASIIAYLESTADRLIMTKRRDEATLLQAMASNIKIQIDIEQGKRDVASPLMAIVIEVAGHFKVEPREILAPTPGIKAVQHARHLAIWVGKKRLNWSHEAMGADLGRDASTISNSIERATQLRAEDDDIRRLTDKWVEHNYVCEHCQGVLIHS